jgi:hypothetical protein
MNRSIEKENENVVVVIVVALTSAVKKENEGTKGDKKKRISYILYSDFDVHNANEFFSASEDEILI